MNHDPALRASAYLAGELSPPEHGEFEEHLLACDDCWDEVAAARRGRRYVTLLREPAPASLRQRIVQLAPPADPAPVRQMRPAHSRWARMVLAAASLVVAATVAGVGLAVNGPVLRSEQPPPIAAAVAGYREDKLPGAVIPKEPAPDLTRFALVPVSAGKGNLRGMNVTAYAYRDLTGRRLVVYRADRDWPLPYEPEDVAGGTGLWFSKDGDVTVLCGKNTRNLMILGYDEELMGHVAQELKL